MLVEAQLERGNTVIAKSNASKKKAEDQPYAAKASQKLSAEATGNVKQKLKSENTARIVTKTRATEHAQRAAKATKELKEQLVGKDHCIQPMIKLHRGELAKLGKERKGFAVQLQDRRRTSNMVNVLFVCV